VDIHIHIPEGATPKDGPSAGITIAVALISSLTGRPSRPFVAMTGEITLRGRVLAVGGIKEKAVAALRNGIRRVLIPAANAPELELLPREVLEGVEFLAVRGMDEVLDAALDGEKPEQAEVDEQGRREARGRHAVERTRYREIADEAHGIEKGGEKDGVADDAVQEDRNAFGHDSLPDRLRPER
jgi:predicted ATP-dependent protease